MNLIATILSVAMMLKYSFDSEEGYKLIENFVKKVLQNGYRITEMGDLIVNNL